MLPPRDPAHTCQVRIFPGAKSCHSPVIRLSVPRLFWPALVTVIMDRPSLLEGTAYQENGQLTEIVVSGHATIIGNGKMALTTE